MKRRFSGPTAFAFNPGQANTDIRALERKKIIKTDEF